MWNAILEVGLAYHKYHEFHDHDDHDHDHDHHHHHDHRGHHDGDYAESHWKLVAIIALELTQLSHPSVASSSSSP